MIISCQPTETEDYMYNYYDYDEMVTVLKDLETRAESKSTNVYSLQSIGNSYEGNPIYAVKFSDNPELEEDGEPVVVIDSGIHPNEIIAQESTINYILYLFDAYYNLFHPDHLKVKKMVEDLQIWIIPMMNPDGRIKDSAGGGGDPAIHYWDDLWPDGVRLNTQPLSCDEAPEGEISGGNLNRAFSYLFSYDDNCSTLGGYNYGGTKPFELHESRILKQFIHNHMVTFVFHQHSPLNSFLTYAGPFGKYISNEIARIYQEDLIDPEFGLLNTYDPARDLESPTNAFEIPLSGQYPPWLWKEITDSSAPDYLSRRGIPVLLFEFPQIKEKYGVTSEGRFGQYTADDGSDHKHMSSGLAVEWLLDKSEDLYNYIIRQTRYFYSPRYYTDMSRKPGADVADLAMVGAKISETGDNLPGCFSFRESDGRDVLTAGTKRITWNVQNNGTSVRDINTTVSICDLTVDPECQSSEETILIKNDAASEEIVTFIHDYSFASEKDYSVLLKTGDSSYKNDLKRFVFTAESEQE